MCVNINLIMCHIDVLSTVVSVRGMYYVHYLCDVKSSG